MQGRTQALNFFGLQRLGNTSLRHDMLLVDAPGYGQRGRPEWGTLFDSYIRTRDRCVSHQVSINVQKKNHHLFKQLTLHIHLDQCPARRNRIRQNDAPIP